MLNQIQNEVIADKGDFDWYAGGNSPINRRTLLPGGDWSDIKIPNEIQVINYGSNKQYESLLCVSFNGTTDAIEYVIARQIELNLIPEEKLEWLSDNGYFEGDYVNFNERFPGALGGTTSKGASVYKVADAIRKFGLIPQKMFPFADNFFDNIDTKFITKKMYDLGTEFLKRFSINFEWVNSQDTAEFMKYSPLGCVGKYANQTSSEHLNPQTGMNHSMLQIQETDEYRKIDDSYWQQYKTYKKSALSDFMAFYVDASDYSMFNREQFILQHDQHIIRNQNTGAYAVIYRNTPMLVLPERASLMLIDRIERGIINRADMITSISNEHWLLLDIKAKF